MEPRPIIEWSGNAFEVAGVAILLIGSLIALGQFGVAIFQRRPRIKAYRGLREGLGRTLILGLEVLVAADIVRSVALEPTLQSVGVLGLIVLVRTFLSWSLEVEVTGVWPWNRAASNSGENESGL